MSIRLEKLGWGRAGAWIHMQANYDLAQIRLMEDNITVYPQAASRWRHFDCMFVERAATSRIRS